MKAGIKGVEALRSPMAGRGGFREEASFLEVLLSRVEDSVGSTVEEAGVRTYPLLLLVLLVERR